jgi:polyhydroxybutyrate depolymerase
MTRETLIVGDRRRSYLHVAPPQPDAGAPLLVALHGTTQTGTTMRRFSGRTLDALAARIGADLVYLDGHRRAWNDARLIATSAAQRRQVDDVGFVRAVVERFDRPAIAIGYSNGGQLIHRLVREAPGLLTGAVVVAAGLPVDQDFALAGVAPDRIPILLVHGTADPVVPYAGGETRLLGRSRGTVRGALATARAYAGEGTEPVRSEAAGGGVSRLDWPGVRLVTQEGTGHVIPNRTTNPPFVGPSHADLDLGEEVQAYFDLGAPVLES